MKKRKKNKKILLFIITGLFIIFLLYFILTKNTRLDNLKSISASIFNLKEKNEHIEENAEIRDLNNEIDKLKKIIGIDSLLTDKKVVTASISKRSMPYWHNIITINKGKKDNIKKGSAVITSSGLIGEVIIVNNNSSEVKLITNQDKNYLSAKFNYNGSDYYGIIKKYNVLTNELYLEDVIGDLDKNVIGIEVVTSGLSSNMPSGLLIGKINDIKKDKYNLSNKITLSISANINDINIVKVVGKDD